MVNMEIIAGPMPITRLGAPSGVAEAEQYCSMTALLAKESDLQLREKSPDWAANITVTAPAMRSSATGRILRQSELNGRLLAEPDEAAGFPL
jgi:hypothetical protein